LLLLVPPSSRTNLLSVDGAWIDEDTPSHLRTTKSLVDGSTYHLVMSDEFNVPGRTFADGHDPAWTALDKSDDDYSASGGGSLHFYNSSMITTTDDGMLTIRSVLEETEWTHYSAVDKEYKHELKHFKSGMIQSWDKFCFTGGIVEVDVILPGEPDIGGLWPAIWLLGNLGRATYEVSTNNLWPWSYDVCDREKQESQLISACNRAEHFGLNVEQGRGATEIDVLELMAGDAGVLPATYPPISLPYVDMTLQVRTQACTSPGLSISLSFHVSSFRCFFDLGHFDRVPFGGRTRSSVVSTTRILAPTVPPRSLARSLILSLTRLRCRIIASRAQVAPGIPDNRPQSGSQPVRTIDHTHSGYATSQAQSWYDNLTVAGNTSLNPFFYGTYLGPTKPNEPVTRNKKQAFQADAVGAMKQIVSEHFKTPHTFRVEWQPGRGGRIDWFTKSHKIVDPITGEVSHVEGDGTGQDWEHSLSIPDSALESAMGSKIPEEPSYLIFNTAISSTWAFPYNVPDWCPKCYDCYDPKCTCSFNPGFCNMMKTGKVSMKIDSVRVYQSMDDAAHSGRPHTLGCDPVDFPTREYIKGFEYKYMRNPPFVLQDKHPLRDVQDGGGTCVVDEDCGGGGGDGGAVEEDVLDLDGVGDDKGGDDQVGGVNTIVEKARAANDAVHRRLGAGADGRDVDFTPRKETKTDLDDDPTAGLDRPTTSDESLEDDAGDTTVPSKSNRKRKPKGRCVSATQGLFGAPTSTGMQCKCNEGYTGPYCLSIEKHDDEPGAYALKKMSSLFSGRTAPYLTKFHVIIGGTMMIAFLAALVLDISSKSRNRDRTMEMKPLRT
jgi:beta-glucanase (GH16 family)